MTSGCALTKPETVLDAKYTVPNSKTKTETKTETETENNPQYTEILKFSQTGEHKKAVDLADKLIKSGLKCPEKVSETIQLSRFKLNQADAYVFEALKYKKEGKLLEAQTTLQKSLDIYPKYYWARNLLKKVERSINAQISGLKEEARSLESNGNLDEALSLVQDAIVLSPDNNDLKLEAARIQNAMHILLHEEMEQKHFAKMLMHMDSGLSEKIKQLLQDEAAAKLFGKDGAEHLQAIRTQRQDIISNGLLAAKKAEQKNDLESAACHTMYVLELSSPGEPLTTDIVKFTRLLGLKLFSAGNFSKARDLWKGALRLAPDNCKLQKYLAEVEESLDNLKKIQPASPR